MKNVKTMPQLKAIVQVAEA